MGTGNGEIDLKPIMADVYRIFSTFDKDRSETLELDELMNLLKACNISITESECEVIMQEMDSNKDGVMDFAEFMAFLGMIFKIRFSRQTQMKEEFERKLKARKSKSEIRRGSSSKSPKPAPPPRKGSVVQSMTKTRS